MGPTPDSSPTRPSVLVLSDGDFVASQGRIAPSADRLHEFLFGLEDRGFDVVLASRCREAPDSTGLLQPLSDKHARTFVPLPSYRSLVGSLPHTMRLRGATHSLLKELLRRHDVVIYRSNHAFARSIGHMARRTGTHAFPWWAAHPWDAIGGGGLTRAMKVVAAKVHLRLMRRNYETAAANVLLDPGAVRFLPDTSRHVLLTPSLLSCNDIADSPPKRERGSPLRVIYAGRLFEAKGVGILIDMLDRHPELRIELAIAGHGPLEPRIRKTIRSGESRLEFLGNLGASELQRVLRSSHVCILPSYSEGMPKILWEAFGSGLPMVATSVGGVPYHVKDDVTGFIVPTGDAGALAAALTRLEQDDELRTRLGDNARGVATEHTRERQLDVIEGEIRSSLQA